MNDDIMNPSEYWTPENLPDGYFIYDKMEGAGTQDVDANFVYNRLSRLDRPNLVENFHALVNFGIANECEYRCRGETFQFFLIQN